MSRFKIKHLTKYTYEGAVRDSANQIMLYPLKDEFLDVVWHVVRISGDAPVSIHHDYFGNEVGTFTHSHPHQELRIESLLEVVTRPRELPLDGLDKVSWTAIEDLRNQGQFIDFLKQESFAKGGEVKQVTDEEVKSSQSPIEVCRRLCTYVYENFTYTKGITTVESTPDEVWNLRSGVCQDFAQILLVMLRMVHVPSRYVSGYICPKTGGMRGEGATHAWVEAFLPTHGWLGLDPTNNCLVNDNHVRLAVGRNFRDCSPVKGTYRGAFDHTLEVEVTVSYEDGHSAADSSTVIEKPMAQSVSKNSFQRHQEMQQQQ